MTTLLTAVQALDQSRSSDLQRACELSLPARAAAASVLTDGLAATPGWRYQDAATRFPQAMALLSSVTRGDVVPQLTTVQKTALSDAMVALVWAEFADSVGSRLVTTLTLPFREVGIVE